MAQILADPKRVVYIATVAVSAERPPELLELVRTKPIRGSIEHFYPQGGFI